MMHAKNKVQLCGCNVMLEPIMQMNIACMKGVWLCWNRASGVKLILYVTGSAKPSMLACKF